MSAYDVDIVKQYGGSPPGLYYSCQVEEDPVLHSLEWCIPDLSAGPWYPRVSQ